MSKYFNETQKLAGLTAQKNASHALEVQNVLDAVGRPDELTRSFADTRLEHCKVHTLNHNTEGPLIYGRSDTCREALESYRALRTRLLRILNKNGLRSVAVTSAAPGEGKTLSSANLAVCCAQLQDFRVLVVDGDLRTRGLTRLLGVPQERGLSELLHARCDFADPIVATDIPNLFVLGAGSDLEPPPELLAGARWKDFMNWCSETFKLVIVDTPPLTPLADTDLILHGCDGALFVVRARKTSRDVVKKAATHIDEKKLLGVIFNAADSHAKDEYQKYYGKSA